MTNFYRVNLTNEEGEVLGCYTVGMKMEFDIEDLNAEPQHTTYMTNVAGEPVANIHELADEIQHDIEATEKFNNH